MGALALGIGRAVLGQAIFSGAASLFGGGGGGGSRGYGKNTANADNRYGQELAMTRPSAIRESNINRSSQSWDNSLRQGKQFGE